MIIPSPASRAPRPSASQLGCQAQRVRPLLEQYRQCRLFDCPYKDPVAVPLQVLEDAGLPVTMRWEEVSQLGLTLMGRVRQKGESADSE